MNEQTDLQMMIPSSDNIATIRHVLGLAKFHRWIRTFNDSWVENDMPSTINFSAEISAYFAVSFPRFQVVFQSSVCSFVAYRQEFRLHLFTNLVPKFFVAHLMRENRTT